MGYSGCNLTSPESVSKTQRDIYDNGSCEGCAPSGSQEILFLYRTQSLSMAAWSPAEPRRSCSCSHQYSLKHTLTRKREKDLILNTFAKHLEIIISASWGGEGNTDLLLVRDNESAEFGYLCFCVFYAPVRGHLR